MSWGHTRPQEIRSEALKEAFPELYEKYEIKPIVGGKNPYDVVDKVRLAIASNSELPEIFQLSSNLLPEFAEAGVLEDVSYVYKGIEDKLLDGMYDLVTYKDRQIGFPYALGLLTWVYREDMFSEAGINVDEIKNEDDFINAGKKLQQIFPDSYIFNFVPEMAMSRFNWVICGNDAKYVDNNGNYIFDKDPGVKNALEALKKIYDSGVCVKINEWTPDWEKGFADGTIASSLIANWIKDKAFLPKYAPDTAGKWGVTLWPSIGGANGGSEQGGALILVLKNAKHTKEAVDMLTKLCFTNEGNIAMFDASEGSLTPLLKEAFNNPKVSAPDPFFGKKMWEAELKAMEVFKVLPYTPASALEEKIITPYLEKYFNDEITLDNLLESVNRDLINQIGNPYKMNN